MFRLMDDERLHMSCSVYLESIGLSEVVFLVPFSIVQPGDIFYHEEMGMMATDPRLQIVHHIWAS